VNGLNKKSGRIDLEQLAKDNNGKLAAKYELENRSKAKEKRLRGKANGKRGLY